MVMNEMITIDLPSLQSIQLGYWALHGSLDDRSNSLVMQSMNEIEKDDRSRSSKSNISHF